MWIRSINLGSKNHLAFYGSVKMAGSGLLTTGHKKTVSFPRATAFCNRFSACLKNLLRYPAKIAQGTTFTPVL